MSAVISALLDGRPEPRPLIINRDECPRLDAPIPRWKYDEVEEERDRYRLDLQVATAAYADLQTRNSDLVGRCRAAENAERALRSELDEVRAAIASEGGSEPLAELERLQRVVATQRDVLARKDAELQKLHAIREAAARGVVSRNRPKKLRPIEIIRGLLGL